MMQRQAKLVITRPGPVKKPTELKPFVTVSFQNNPWTLCRPELQDVILVNYGNIVELANRLCANLTEGQRYWVLERRREHKYHDGRAFKIQFKRMANGTSIQGGRIWLRNARGIAVTINDVKGLFQMTFRKVAKLYGTDNLAEIMERARSSLAAVGVEAFRKEWYRCSSLTDYVWRQLGINLPSVPCMSSPKGPGNLQGYHAFGHTDHPVYSYDIRSAYLSVMAEFEPLRPFTDFIWHARQELEQASDPAAHVLKLAATIMPGKFTSRLSDLYYRPVLGNYIRQRVNGRLQDAMTIADKFEAPTHLNVIRYCVDGFIAQADISRYLDIGDQLGQWKPVKRHEHLTIAKTNVWWTNREFKDGGYHLTEPDLLNGLEADPYEVATTRVIFDPVRLEERIEPITLRQNHTGLGLCRRCWNGTDRELHDRG